MSINRLLTPQEGSRLVQAFEAIPLNYQAAHKQGAALHQSRDRIQARQMALVVAKDLMPRTLNLNPKAPEQDQSDKVTELLDIAEELEQWILGAA